MLTPSRLALATVLALSFTPVAASKFTDLMKQFDANEMVVEPIRQAAERGVSADQFTLANMYSMGDFVAKDDAEAMKWYRLAANQGHTDAQYALGVMYKSGSGVLQDNVMAHMWFNIASANGRFRADTRRDELAGEMTSVDISKAQAKARECMSSGYTKCGY